MSNLVVYSEEQIGLLKRTIATGATTDELALFVNQCQRTGLDPFTRQIYFIKDKQGKVTVCSSIDGLRLVAERSDKYEGQTKPEWCGEDGVWKDIWLDDNPPKAARIGVWKSKFREPTYGVALFDEYAGRYAFDDNYGKFKKGDLTFMWNKMPALMIAKVAEALALRKAFPNDLSGIYSSEEADLINKDENEKVASGKPAQIESGTPQSKPSTEVGSESKPENESQAPKANSGAMSLPKNEDGAKKAPVKNEAPITMKEVEDLYNTAFIKRGWKPEDFDNVCSEQYKVTTPLKMKRWMYDDAKNILNTKR